MAVKKKAEEVFNKSESELSEMEHMMSDIMSGSGSTDSDTAAEVKPAEAPKPPEKKHILHPMPVITEPVTEQDTEETEPFDSGAGARKTLARNEKKAARALKKSRKTPVIIILALVILAAGALFGAILQTLRDDTVGVDNAASYSGSPSTGSVANENITIPTPDPQEVIENLDSEAAAPNVVIMSGTGTTVDHSNGQHYMLFAEDTSWRGAMENCDREGGHLVTVTSDEEFAEVAAMAEAAGVEYLWIGCHRDDSGNYVWENSETFEIPAAWWGKGEPSMYDSGDNVPEDYLLLWYHDGKWVLNDSRNNPVMDYPEMYSGNIAYICEYEQN